MTFDVLAIRTADQDAGTMYPVIGGDGLSVVLDESDGDDLLVVEATALTVGELTATGLRRINRVQQIKVDTIISDSRVAMACAKLDRGGGWVGFDESASVMDRGLNIFAKARAAYRNKGNGNNGKMLVGHVRFPWLSQVGGRPRQRLLGEECLRMVLGENCGGGRRLLAVDVTLPKTVDSLHVAQTIARRAARFRLEQTDVPDEHVDALHALVAAERLVPEPTRFAMYTIPSVFDANPRTAFPVRSTAESERLKQ